MNMKLPLAIGAALGLSACCQTITPLELEQRASESLQGFLTDLSNGDARAAFERIDGVSKRQGDADIGDGPITETTISQTLASRQTDFAAFTLGKPEWESKRSIRIPVTFSNGDRDRALLVSRSGQWQIANPLHLIR